MYKQLRVISAASRTRMLCAALQVARCGIVTLKGNSHQTKLSYPSRLSTWHTLLLQGDRAAGECMVHVFVM